MRNPTSPNGSERGENKGRGRKGGVHKTTSEPNKPYYLNTHLLFRLDALPHVIRPDDVSAERVRGLVRVAPGGAAPVRRPLLRRGGELATGHQRRGFGLGAVPVALRRFRETDLEVIAVIRGRAPEQIGDLRLL